MLREQQIGAYCAGKPCLYLRFCARPFLFELTKTNGRFSEKPNSRLRLCVRLSHAGRPPRSVKKLPSTWQFLKFGHAPKPHRGYRHDARPHLAAGIRNSLARAASLFRKSASAQIRITIFLAKIFLKKRFLRRGAATARCWTLRRRKVLKAKFAATKKA